MLLRKCVNFVKVRFILKKFNAIASFHSIVLSLIVVAVVEFFQMLYTKTHTILQNYCTIRYCW